MAFVRPIDTQFVLPSVLDVPLSVQKAFDVVRVALGNRTRYQSIGPASGSLMVHVAPWLSVYDRGRALAGRVAFVLLWLGFGAVFRAISNMTLALH